MFFLLGSCPVRMGSLGSHPVILQENLVDALRMAEEKEQAHSLDCITEAPKLPWDCLSRITC